MRDDAEAIDNKSWNMYAKISHIGAHMNWQYLLLLLIIIASLSNCVDKEQELIAVEYIYFDDNGIEVFSRIQEGTFLMSQYNTVLKYDYLLNDYRVIYEIDTSKYVGAITWNDKTINVVLDQEYDINVMGRKFRVWEFVNLEPSIDGGMKYFFCKECGLLFSKSTTWHTYTVLRRSEISFCSEISLFLAIKFMGYNTDSESDYHSPPPRPKE